MYYGFLITESAITTVSKIPNVYVDLAERAQMQYYLARYMFDGTFLGMKPLENELNLCDNTLDWKNTGHNINATCHVNLAYLADDNTETIFYELCKFSYF